MAKKKFNFNIFRKPKEAKLNAVKFGVAGGITIAICVFFTTIIEVLGLFGGLAGWTSLITEAYGSFGYGVSFLGAIFGAVYSFIDGFILTWIFALIYNKLL
ncbi:hypothetical protein CMI49_02155 [Candidatus Pacearchaeota archaeon]|jgi:hypothetical protein|nr:hypothetical protein [Candidatus Pacearchaeota archaeon]|tara:strand:+ start:6781 stop:7083 length:303 start_codon:yes stop_codon:yes gene_type:complete